MYDTNKRGHDWRCFTSPTIAECLKHGRQCEWYAARTNDEEDRKFLLRRAQQWTKLAREKEIELCQGPRLRRLAPSHYKQPLALLFLASLNTCARSKPASRRPCSSSREIRSYSVALSFDHRRLNFVTSQVLEPSSLMHQVGK
jgi:uncharacterized protein (DUF2132 family)